MKKKTAGSQRIFIENISLFIGADMHSVNVNLSLAGMVSPDMKDRELQKHFGCATPKDLLDKFFNGGEISKIADAVTELSGYGKDKKKKVKNS